MGLSDSQRELSVRIVMRMLKKGVWGGHHKQKQSIAKWFPVHERGDVKRAIDDMIPDTDVPIMEKGRGTVTLWSKEAAREYLREHGREPPDPTNW